MNVVPSGIRDADGSGRGLLSAIAQTIAGIKTFTSKIVASLGVEVGSIWNTNGTGASDVVVKVGSNVADASVNASAKLLSVRTGIGGTEVEKAYFDATGALVVSANPNSRISVAGGVLLLGANTLPAQALYLASVAGQTTGFYAAGAGNASGAHSAAGRWRGWSETLGGTSTDTVMVFGTLVADASVHADARLMTLRAGLLGTEVEKWAVRGSGRVDRRGNVSATVGNDTQNQPAGVNTLQSGQTTCIVTNSLVTANSWINVTFHGDPGGRVWVTRAAGSFTVNVSAAPGANVAFSWEVSTLI